VLYGGGDFAKTRSGKILRGLLKKIIYGIVTDKSDD